MINFNLGFKYIIQPHNFFKKSYKKTYERKKMTKIDLGLKLKEMYENAKKNDGSTMIRLFGIKYANELKNCNASMTEIAKISEIGESYHAEISKGIRLAQYVVLK